MNRDSEAAESLLHWLLQASGTDNEEWSGAYADDDNPQQQAGETESASSEPWDPLDSEDLSDYLPSQMEGIAADLTHAPSNASSGEIPSVASGENFSVKNHLYALLKRRLRSEIERRPPLFPWEREVQDYPMEYPDWIDSESVPMMFWQNQIQAFQWPIALPQPVLMVLLDRAQAIAQSSLKSGVKLVQMVEALFPNESDTLNYLAGAVLMSPTRSGRLSAFADPTRTNLPEDYESAAPVQQMVLSLLAARDILDQLTLTLESRQLEQERQWTTPQGLLRIRASYQRQPSLLQIDATLPSGGRLVLSPGATERTGRTGSTRPAHPSSTANTANTNGTDSTDSTDSTGSVGSIGSVGSTDSNPLSNQRPDAGTLGIALPHPPSPASYGLDVTLFDADQSTLHLVIQLEDMEG